MSLFLGIIPARFASTRFPGKPLAMLGQRPMIQWVYESASQVFDQLVVATDDQRICDAVEAFGGRAVMTSTEHQTGTERCAEALGLYRRESGIPFTHVVNIQGDEPLIKKEQLSQLKECIQEPGTEIATLIRATGDPDELENPNIVKVVVDKTSRALYFSRSIIPYIRDRQWEQTGGNIHFIHIGLYAYRSDILEKLVKLTRTPLELAESLEQLRWLEHGFSIRTMVTPFQTRGIDTPGDLDAIRSQL